jgi:hypothetical protein
MTDPVTRAAKRQNVIDRLAEQLAEWGCPPDTAATRAGALLFVVESHGWSLPTVAAPPLSGRGSTAEGRFRARRSFEQARAGCRCTGLGDVPAMHDDDCPIAVAAVPS